MAEAEEVMKKRVLIIGSSGMLGRDLAHELRSGYEVCGADIVGSGKSVKKFYSCDITKKKNVCMERIKKHEKRIEGYYKYRRLI